MWKITLGAFLWLTASVNVSAAQRATELFIPIGESPALSNEVTVIGTVEEVDAERRTLVVESEGDRVSATVTDETEIYLDRSELSEKNEYGAFGDLTEGARVEILYATEERATEGPARWIKVEMSSTER